MVMRRASQASRSAVSGLIGPAPSSIGGRVLAEVHDQRGAAALHALERAAAAARDEADERIGGGLLPLQDDAILLLGGAARRGVVPDRRLERDALLERQAPVDQAARGRR